MDIHWEETHATIVGSQDGAPTDQVWVHNLRVNPDVEIRDETVVRPMRAREVEDEDEFGSGSLPLRRIRLTRNAKSAPPGGFRPLLQSGLSEVAAKGEPDDREALAPGG